MTSTAMSSTLLSLTRPPIKSTVNVNINNNNTEAFSRRGLTLIRTTTTTPSSTNNNAPLILHKNSVAIAPASTYTTDSIGSAFKLPEDKQPVLVTSQSLSTSTDPKVGVSSCSVSHSLLMEVQQSKVPEVSKNNDNATPVIRFISTPEGNQVRFPSDVVLKEKFPPRCIKRPPEKVLCGALGCKNVKKYSCSKTKVPLCSLECYKKNLKRLNLG